MDVICLEDAAFYILVERVVARIQEVQSTKQPKWITVEQAMQMLHITSKTTLQKLRDTGKIRFAQATKKLIYYDADSINDYLSGHSKNTF